MSCGLNKLEVVDVILANHDNLESIEAKSFKEMKEDFEATMLEMQQELDKIKGGITNARVQQNHYLWWLSRW